MISFCLLNETLSGMYYGVRDGNLGAIGSNAWDTTKRVGRGIATGVNTVANGAVAAGQHVVRNKEPYGIIGGLGAGLVGGAYLAKKAMEFANQSNNG